ncbi:MAG: hypothetical protein ACREQO_19415, partial [Candidatus Binatia bacterium]
MKVEPPRASRLSLQESREPTALSGQRWLLNEAGGRTVHGSLPLLKVGQEISALVVEQLADGRLVLDLGGSLVEANDPGGLSSGQTLRLRVDLIDPQVMLHIVEQDLSVEGELTKLMRRYLPGDEQVSLAALSEGLAARGPFEEFGTPLRLDRLKLLLAGLFQKRELLTPAGLKEFVREGGLHYEMKLSKAAAGDPAQLSQIADRDLKGLLLGALDELNKVGSQSDLRKIIAGQLHRIEGQQVANLLAQFEGHSIQLQIPFFSATGFSTVALAVKPDGRTKSGPGERRKEGYNILFIFDLEDFGRTRINAHLRDRDLSVTFYIELESSLTLLRG